MSGARQLPEGETVKCPVLLPVFQDGIGWWFDVLGDVLGRGTCELACTAQTGNGTIAAVRWSKQATCLCAEPVADHAVSGQGRLARDSHKSTIRPVD